MNSLKEGKMIIDNKTCSLFIEKILQKKFKLSKKEDPIYLLKSIKNKNEINGMIKSHIIDGAALTKFLYWIKVINKKKISEIDAQNKLEKFRKKNKEYLFPSFDTIAGSGENGAIVHYRAKKKIQELLTKKIFFYATQVDNINMERQMLQGHYVFQNKNNILKIFLLKF